MLSQLTALELRSTPILKSHTFQLDDYDVSHYSGGGSPLKEESSSSEYEVELIKGKREVKRDQGDNTTVTVVEYLVKYAGSERDEWHSEEDLAYCFKLVKQYEER